MSFATYPSLSERVVLITGGASGIGADTVRAFAANGARVAFLDLQQEAGEALARELAAAAAHAPLFLRCDVTDIPALQAAIGTVRDRLGPVAVLVNNAADDNRQPVADVTQATWDHAQDVNLRHHFFAAQAVHPHMKEVGFGSIVNFSSIAWRFGASEMAPYAAAKAAVVGLTFALARAFGPDNIRVNAIEPGAVITDRQRELWYKTEGSVDQVVQRQVIRKVLLGEEIARTVLFLAADDSRMITKQSITVDAGLR
ncbi:SDR family NAD(P)-dependent oxidoreductase [Mesorhizobium sp. RSR565B]|uniref:SDR family NAD(P)-dependent oxidoreductase n=1 Tax=unclassified Mesorhizobium TaxID=325217 RepID=UPI0003CF851D|nr:MULTISPECIES: SDR family oxidoreductase [unclassified Mesorhizobium]ESX48795.1 3-oxoacyl-ACP reductase [Mesorhizobium sp. LSHC426A00]ESX55573.1 3-oxoacyl-ACP reductase [Mesorhizobium sp. LSHC424B00]ESX72013.1 3-oxoacyl-ACP reductase [Mesorhizobium sp. LSHC416B00]ESZ45365.1 3-oxoacyl-ACP reductase [Mesorhizobium sp. L103C565B0]ESZ65852.1 3-oxoacyl-ACP reductase [Mesorhizobium sp. L103C131B0]